MLANGYCNWNKCVTNNTLYAAYCRESIANAGTVRYKIISNAPQRVGMLLFCNIPYKNIVKNWYSGQVSR